MDNNASAYGGYPPPPRDWPQPAASSKHWQQHTPVPVEPRGLLGPSALVDALADKVANLVRINQAMHLETVELRDRVRELEGQVAELIAAKP